MIRTAAMDAMAGRDPISVSSRDRVASRLCCAAELVAEEACRSHNRRIRPAKKPDIDNVIKAWTDAMNGVVFADDCQIVTGSFSKVYGPAPLVAVINRPISTDGSQNDKPGRKTA